MATAIAALFALALVVFVLPFAFPTPPPIVTRFQATRLFSPDADGRRDVARINVRLHEPSTVSVEIQRDGEPVAAIVPGSARPRGFTSDEWDGRDDEGRRVPDGTYAIKLAARGPKGKQFNKSRKIVVDTQAPEPAAMDVESAVLAGAGPGQCRLRYRARDPGSAVIDVFRPEGSTSLRRLGPRPLRAGGTLRWAWNGRARAGERVAPGLYVLRASLSDAARNRSVRERSCFVGYLAGSARPARPAPRDRVGVALRRTDGRPLPPSTPVVLTLRRRTGVPGATVADPLGDQVGGGARGQLGRVRVRIPAGINPDALWLVAQTRGRERGTALVRLGPTP